MPNNESAYQAVTRDKLVSDFKVVVRDAEELLKATASDLGDKANVARTRIEQTLKDARHRLAAAESVVMDRTKEAAEAADQYVQDNPWRAVSIAAGIGLVLGLLIGRR
jgi:ElaB/YqjD/DUF883 family membrane-anchored ribosome-binding protein